MVFGAPYVAGDSFVGGFLAELVFGKNVSSNTLGAHSPESQTITSHIISSLSRVLETLN
jgi:sugar/nucleoside kinase (ribokinase family)